MKCSTLLFGCWMCCVTLIDIAEGQTDLFRDQVAPLFERRCLTCHNDRKQEGGFSLQAPRSAWAEDYVVPGDPKGSYLLDLITPVNREAAMPKDADPLSDAEVNRIRDWIEAGAEWPKDLRLDEAPVADLNWWSLRPLKPPTVPRNKGTWPRNEVDQFVLAKLQEQGLSPSLEADPRTLVRRLTFDLTGLPPTPEEVQRFIAESKVDSDQAYEKLVLRLLDSPRYGEQWARLWLDVARYGESHGYDKDKARFNAWPYRDYVIRSFNDDKPWTQFVQQQVAGDVLFPKDPAGVIALGFVAAGPWDHIAHVEVGEGKLDGRIAKHLDRDDMISAVFNAFMSTTVQCAQCHHHKFDPISMTDYYRLHTIFAAVDRRDRPYDLDPEDVKQRLKLENDIAELGKQLRDIDKEIEEDGGTELRKLQANVAKLKEASRAAIDYVPVHGYHSQIVRRQDEEKWIQLELPERSRTFSKVRLRACYDDYAKIGSGFGFPVRFRVQASDDAQFSKNVRTLADHTQTDFANPGLTPVDLPGGGGRFLRITATKLAERKEDFIFALAEVELLDAYGKNLARTAKVTALDSIESGKRWARSNVIDGKYSSSRELTLEEEMQGAVASLQKLKTRIETPDRLARRSHIQRQQEELQRSLSKIPNGNLVYALATDFKPAGKVLPTHGEPRKIHLLHRGDLRSPGEEMAPGAPALWKTASSTFDLKANHSEGERRAALAKYLTHPDNPLLWRSAANRIWLGHMGRGIVDSPNDFGRMGMQPTHPKLLDWLAVRFRETESIKELHRMIVMSSTYRQTSTEDPQKSAIDGGNMYYWRASRRKLRAEELRDSVLQVAGVLSFKMGGPSFQDFEFKDDHTPKYKYHLHDPNDPSTHRRTIYRFIARSQTQPFLTTLDCADPSQMVPKRDETTTALQALALMNNPFMTAMSEKLADRAKDIEHAIWLALGRRPTEVERKTLESYAEKHGMPATARVIFNLNEFTFVD